MKVRCLLMRLKCGCKRDVYCTKTGRYLRSRYNSLLVHLMLLADPILMERPDVMGLELPRK